MNTQMTIRFLTLLITVPLQCWALDASSGDTGVGNGGDALVCYHRTYEGIQKRNRVAKE